MSRKIFLALLVLMAFSPAFGQQYVQVFVTSLSYDGNFGGIDGADQACTDAATDAGLDGTWTAWMSDSDTNAFDRILDSEYRLLDGVVVANSLFDLTHNELLAPININENGEIQGGAPEVWTSTDMNGTVDPLWGTCQDWTSSDNAETARVGSMDARDVTWTDSGEANSCDLFNRLYCFANAEVPVELQEFSVE